jgi:hypothetical protein
MTTRLLVRYCGDKELAIARFRGRHVAGIARQPAAGASA